jgi:ribosomal protein S18 acetylase RimI-like enzyme
MTPLPTPVHWRLRPVVAADEPLLRRIHAGTCQAELQATDWSETQREQFLDLQFREQRAHYDANNPGAEHHVIEAAADSMAWSAEGHLWLHRRPDALHVLDIALLPACRGRGLGTRVLQALMVRAAGSGRVVSVYVLQGNPARGLYERLGFVAVGPLAGRHQRMVWQAAMQLASRAGAAPAPAGRLLGMGVSAPPA